MHSTVQPTGTPSAYERYVRTDELLSLQPVAEELVDPDEMIFLIVQQSSELWLKLLTHGLDAALQAAEADSIIAAVRHLARSRSYLTGLTQQLDVLDQISPWAYQKMRRGLEDGSGFSSPGWSDVRSRARSLGQVFEAILSTRGITLEQVYLSHLGNEELFQLAEGLLNLDNECMLWRLRHLKVIERLVGIDAVGTAGTPIAVLAKLTQHRFYPWLWQVRSTLTKVADEQLPLRNIVTPVRAGGDR